MTWRFLAAGLLGAVCYLDRTAAFQVMLHRPLVVASLVGAAFGNLAALKLSDRLDDFEPCALALKVALF